MIKSHNICTYSFKTSLFVLTRRMCFIPKSGFQSLFKVFTHISPLLATFGWKILVRKYALGGVWGKSLPNTNFTLNRPPVYGVPAVKKICNKWLDLDKYCTVRYIPGPSMNACRSVTSVSFITIRIPSGGSFISSSCSLTIRRMVCGDKFSTLEIWNERTSIHVQIFSWHRCIIIYFICDFVTWGWRVVCATYGTHIRTAGNS